MKLPLGLNFIVLQIGFVILSLVGVAAKVASGFALLSLGFLLSFAVMVCVLAVYAVVWQLSLNKVSLSSAYGMRGIVVLWSLLWAVLFFGEAITHGNMLGAFLIIAGTALIGDK